MLVASSEAPGSSTPHPKQRRTVGALERGLFVVPDVITSIGLLSGCLSLISAFDGHFERAAAMIEFSLVCDILDGLVARASHAASAFGIEYDSLSDLIAFGVAPASLVYSWALKPLGLWGALIIGPFVISAALRLARFNIQAGTIAGKKRFVGLPVPGAAVMIAGLLFGYRHFALDLPRALCAGMAVVTLVLAGVMVSRIPYPAPNLAGFRERGFEAATLALVLALLLVLAPRLTAFLGALAYVLSGPVLAAAGEQIEAAAPAVSPTSEHLSGPEGTSTS